MCIRDRGSSVRFRMTFRLICRCPFSVTPSARDVYKRQLHSFDIAEEVATLHRVTHFQRGCLRILCQEELAVERSRNVLTFAYGGSCHLFGGRSGQVAVSYKHLIFVGMYTLTQHFSNEHSLNCVHYTPTIHLRAYQCKHCLLYTSRCV